MKCEMFAQLFDTWHVRIKDLKKRGSICHSHSPMLCHDGYSMDPQHTVGGVDRVDSDGGHTESHRGQ